MSKANWVDPGDIQVFQPATPEQLLERKADIELCLGADYDPSIWDWALNYFPSFWLFYLHGEPVGVIRRDFFRRSVQLHGHTRPGYQKQGIQHYAVLACLHDTFFIIQRGPNTVGYPKVTIEMDPGNLGVKGFVRKWGFEKTNRPGFYQLKRDKFIGMQHAQK